VLKRASPCFLKKPGSGFQVENLKDKRTKAATGSSTSIGTKNAPVSAQDDWVFVWQSLMLDQSLTTKLSIVLLIF
jgi:hypothetical protein